MSARYDEYIVEHTSNVQKAYDWIKTNLSEILPDGLVEKFNLDCLIRDHDQSKFEQEEYVAYDDYFYGGNKSYEVVKNFNYAWLRHIHKNPHHWQHWVLIADEPEEGDNVLDMPYNYIIEMICDWWSFSWKKGKLDEIFEWYEEHEDNMRLSNDTRKCVESILAKIKAKLEESDTNGTGDGRNAT